MKNEHNIISLGRLKISSPIVLAPLAGYTDSPFRRIVRSHGAGFTVTELLSAEGIVRNNKKTKKLLKFTDEERPLGIQIFGNNPQIMETAAQIVEALKPDFIDINMGCCAPKVCNGGMGAALLKNPMLVRKIAESVVKAVQIPVSAKIRIGWDYQNLNYREIVEALEDAGVDFITVHGRTKSQMFMDKANWSIISEIASFSKVPIIGNGDIASFNEALERLSESGCSAVMIGRKAIGNPWIFSGKIPSFSELFEQIVQHIDLMIAEYGDYGIILMRKHLVKYIHGFPGAARMRSSLLQAKTYAELMKLLNEVNDEVKI